MQLPDEPVVLLNESSLFGEWQATVTERSARHGMGWIEPELMQKTMDITFASNKPEKPLVVNNVFTNQFNSRIKP